MKRELINKIVNHLTTELDSLINAANNAHLAAIDEQSIAETQYDTLAIEQSYLAQGQSRRVKELQQAILSCKNMPLHESPKPNSLKPVALASLVQLAQDQAVKSWFFIAPAAAGYRTQIAELNITVITPQSPMGKVLMGKQIDDDVCLTIQDKLLEDYICDIK